MLIIEGTDGVGKTTLARKLLARLPSHVYSHFSRLPEGFDYYWGYAARIAPDVVQDRFHMSEVAYSAARGERSNLDPDGYALVDTLIRQVGGLVVVVTADEDLVRARWDRSQMYDLETTLAAGRAFLDVVSRPSFYRADIDLHLHCDEGNPYVDDNAVDAILDAYTRRRARIRSVLGRRPARL